ncbi:hypothetical protein ACTPOK_40520 [Streptomyces inhibens]
MLTSLGDELHNRHLHLHIAAGDGVAVAGRATDGDVADAEHRGDP